MNTFTWLLALSTIEAFEAMSSDDSALNYTRWRVTAIDYVRGTAQKE